MNRRTYLNFVSGGITTAISGALPSPTDNDATGDTEQNPQPELEDFLVQERHLRDEYELLDSHTGDRPNFYYTSFGTDMPTSRTVEHRFGLLDTERSAPAELTSRVNALPASGSPSPPDLERLHDWVLQDCWTDTDPPNHNFTDWADVITDRKSAGECSRHTLWIRKPILQRRTDVPQPDPLPSRPYVEYATVIQKTDWGVLDLTLSVEYPAERKQTLNTIRRLADWQSQLVKTLSDPHIPATF